MCLIIPKEDSFPVAIDSVLSGKKLIQAGQLFAFWLTGFGCIQHAEVLDFANLDNHPLLFE